MTHFDYVYELAADNYGLVTFAQAQAVGVTSVELRRFVTTGRLERLGHGVYKLVRYIPTPYDQYAEAVALVGPGSYIHGESVLALHNLAMVNPLRTTVTATRRTRKKLPNWIQVVGMDSSDEVLTYEGIPCQSVAGALRFCRNHLMRHRLKDAVRTAIHQGLIDEATGRSLRKELNLWLPPRRQIAGAIST
jgi:hypothetical protein